MTGDIRDDLSKDSFVVTRELDCKDIQDRMKIASLHFAFLVVL